MVIKIKSIKENKPDIEVIAVKPLNAYFGVGIIEIVYGIDDGVKFTFIDDCGYAKTYNDTIKYDSDNNAYFTFKDEVHYINDFIRV